MHKLVIDADKKQALLNFRELFNFRDLFITLTYRDIKVRYAQTFLGIIWALVQPVITLLIFILIFNKAINVNTGDIPYPVFALCGMSAWAYFSFVMAQSGNSIIAEQAMIKKIYFPRLIIPLSKGVTGLVDFFIALLLVFIVIAFYGLPLTLNLLYLPFFILLNIITALGAGIWISALSIRFRDFQHIVPFVIQLGLYASPIAYPASIIPEKYVGLYYLNPMAFVVEGFRWSLAGGVSPHPYGVFSVLIVLSVFVSGLIYFNKTEQTMADIV
ncbi:MAG: ABC transporter permease [Bacteroidota bacterium]|nr:ABC transporter permease [Bacteroidota bacterium]